MLRRVLKNASLVPAALTAAGAVAGYLVVSRSRTREDVIRPGPGDGDATAAPEDKERRRRRPVQQYVRTAGPSEMTNPPSDGWNEVDEASDESFPASDPPGRY
jgi:hypothetical protein